MIKVDKHEVSVSGVEPVILAETMILLEVIEDNILTNSLLMKACEVKTLEDLIVHYRENKPSKNVEKTQELKDLVKEIVEDLNKIEG